MYTASCNSWSFPLTPAAIVVLAAFELVVELSVL